MKYHFQNKVGWMNDPNGLVFFKGKYHAFFQHYPHATHWGQMHWGHAVSSDLVNWEEKEIALYPDMPYEDEGGCFSGSAIVKDDTLYLFYTSVSHELGQTQSVAISKDGETFVKYEGNPVIKESPLGNNRDFRDPKVFLYEGKYKMVVGAGISNVGKILLFESDDLLNWEYVGEILSDMMYGPCAECPDLFKVEDKWVLMFSSIKATPHRVNFSVGDFDGKRFIPDNEEEPFFAIEEGPDFYAPQTFYAPDGRVILIGWMYNWHRSAPVGKTHVGALTIPREISFDFDGKLVMRPIREIAEKIKPESTFVSYRDGLLRISFEGHTILQRRCAYEPTMKILEDSGVVEVFLEGGRHVITTYIC